MPIDGRVAVQDLLEHLGVGHQALASRNQAFQEHLGLRFSRVGSPDQVHGEFGVDEDQLR